VHLIAKVYHKFDTENAESEETLTEALWRAKQVLGAPFEPCR